jgi:hypothetical protein
MASETLTRGVLPRVQWGPVIAGVLCAIAVQIVLGLFGLAFGFASEPAGRGLGILAGVWGVIVTPIAASFVGALVAVRIAAERLEAGAFLHGALVWCIGLIAGAIFLGGLASSGAMSLGSAASAVAPRTAVMGRAQARDDVARGAAAGTGAAAVGALLGLGGALLGAAVGRQLLTGESLMRRRRGAGDPELRREYRTGESAGAYGSVPRAPGAGERSGETPLHH